MPKTQHVGPPASRYGMASSVFFAHLDREVFARRWEPFDYVMEWLPLTAGAANSKDQFAVDASLGFVLGGINMAAVIAGAEGTEVSFVPATIQLGINSGDMWSSDPVHLTTIVGNGRDTCWMPAARYLAPSTTVSATMASLLAAGGNNFNIRLRFIGWHVYPLADS